MIAVASAIRNGFSDLRKALHFGVWGAAGGLSGAFVDEVVGLGGRREELAEFGELVTKVGFWFAVIGALIAVSILLGQEKYAGRSLALAVRGPAIRRLALGTLFSGVSGFLAGAVAQGLYTAVGPTEVLRVICWGVAGGSLGLALSFRIPNLTRSRGLAGGLAGGVLGGIVFIGSSAAGSQTFGRLIGVSAIGFSIGLMIMLADAMFRKAWLEVRYGPREARTLTLGGEPVRIGSDASNCEVYVHDVPAIACTYRFENGQIFCDDRINRQNGPVAFGIATRIGNVTVTPRLANEQDTERAQGNSASRGRPAQVYSTNSILSLSDGRQFVLAEGARITAKDVRGLESIGGDGSVAEVSCHPTDPGVFGLKNLSQRAWHATLVSGREVQVEPGRSIRIEVGARIDFGAAQGVVNKPGG
jgi:hypothetical protein